VPKRADANALERGLDRLYGLELDEFTAARNSLARELKDSGDSEGAARVKELKKPSRSAGAINRAARQSRRDVKRLLDAASKLGDAQERLLKGEGRRAVDQAVERERAAVERLMAAVETELERDGGASESMLGRARDTLHAVATDPELRDELEAGRVSADHTSVGLGGLTAGGGGRPSAKASKKAARSAAKSDARRRLKRAERELEDAERTLQRAESARSEAKKSLAAAESAVTRSEKQVAEAAGARDEARSALEGA
jgi:hypothetical protein